MSNSKDIDRYQAAYSADYDFEREMVRARQRMVRQWLEGVSPVSVVEIGCGQKMLYPQLVGIEYLECWVIVEPADFFADRARGQLSGDACMSVLNLFTEEAVSEIWEILPEGADAVICSSVLHEVPGPMAFLQAAAAMGRPGGSLLAARLFPQEAYDRGVKELLGRTKIPSRESDLETFLQASLGPTLTAELIDPVLRKLYGHAYSELAPSSSIFYFGLNRVIILDAEATNRLRENEVLIDAFEQAASID